MVRLIKVLAVLSVCLPLEPVLANEAFTGTWVTDARLSSALDPFRRVELEIEVKGEQVTIVETYTTGRRSNTETYVLDTGGEENVVPVSWWSANRHIGAYLGGDKTMRMQAEWIDDGMTLQITSHFLLETSQADTPVRTHAEYRLSRDGNRLTRLELRSTRNLPVIHVYNRK
jgi:hypothetical protein